MSLSLAIAVIVIADLAVIGALAFVMSRAAVLTPHLSANGAAPSQPALGAAHVRHARAASRVSASAVAAQA